MGQAILGALVGISFLHPTHKQGQHQLLVVARGAVQGHFARDCDQGAASDDNSITELDKVLIAMQQATGLPEPPKVESAICWLKVRGAKKVGNTLGRISSLRNLPAHSAGSRVIATVEGLMAGNATIGSDVTLPDSATAALCLHQTQGLRPQS